MGIRLPIGSASKQVQRDAPRSRYAHLSGIFPPRFLPLRCDTYLGTVTVLISTESPLRLQHVTIASLRNPPSSTRIATTVNESRSKKYKSLFLRQQFAAINTDLCVIRNGYRH